MLEDMNLVLTSQIEKKDLKLRRKLSWFRRRRSRRSGCIATVSASVCLKSTLQTIFKQFFFLSLTSIWHDTNFQNAVQWLRSDKYFITDRVRSTRGGNSFTLYVCSHLRGGGGTRPGPARSRWGEGVPCQGGTQVPPGQVQMGEYLSRVPPPGQVQMGGYPGKTTEGVLATRRSVCLLRSRRRTFLFSEIYI